MDCTSRYDLSADEIWTQLPKMDVGETLVARYCPDFASPMQCVPGRYRRHDGLCNNLRFPTRGATRAAFARLEGGIFASEKGIMFFYKLYEFKQNN